MKDNSKIYQDSNKQPRHFSDKVKRLRNSSIVLPWGFRMEIKSDREAVVWGVKSICDYSLQKIALRHKGGIVIFEGCGLSCQSYMEGAVCIRGCILSVQFDRS